MPTATFDKPVHDQLPMAVGKRPFLSQRALQDEFHQSLLQSHINIQELLYTPGLDGMKTGGAKPTVSTGILHRALNLWYQL